ncbi:hypothetical protein [Streptomyces vilmorinianum]|uniref:hypothetical protein n=1 Tax=Streptomyces vilmorinianum TaxID=3051092 RepID=UPI0010FAEF5A|nr:hypothetical protein [Streptomyces vilmorinianum]
MISPDLAEALRRVETVFGGMTAKPGDGCLYCYGDEELALLAVPRAPLSDAFVRIAFHEVPSHFVDHPAVLRRLLPPFLAYVADGRFDGMGYLPTGLGRTAWQEWPREQADAVRGFLDVWWRETLRVPDPPYGVQAVFELCSDMYGSVTPLLDHWASRRPGGVEDRHLAARAESWIDDLLSDDASLIAPWAAAPDARGPVAELQAWLVEQAPSRLAGHPLLARKVALLALPPEERWIAYSEMVAETS